MKKSLSLVLALVFVLGIAGTAFAANPFVDVPAKHWSYDAVSKLAKAGIVDGYDDGTFRGDKTMTRYEMAQVVAKAMAKSDKADAANKALIEKLSAEYSAELNNLGVRVGKLEANASNLKFTADLRVRYNTMGDNPTAQGWKDRFRLNMTSQINENTSLYARFIYSDDSFNKDDAQRLSDMALTTKNVFPNTAVTLGRYTLNMAPIGYLSGTTGDLDGIMTNTQSGNFGLMMGYAQARQQAADNLSVTASTDRYGAVTPGLAIKNVAFTEATYATGKAKFYLDYFKNLNAGSDGIADAYKIFGGALTYKFDDNWKFAGEYFTNSANGAKWNGSNPKAYGLRVNYKGAVASQPNTFGLQLDYMRIEGNAVPYKFAGPMYKVNPVDLGLNSQNDGFKAFATEFDYTLAKNITFNAIYQFDIKALKGGNPYGPFTRAQINYLF